MKTLSSFRRLSVHLTIGCVALSVGAPLGWTGPGGGGFSGGVANSSSASNVGPAGGGIGGVSQGSGVSSGGGHGMTSAGQHVNSGLSAGGNPSRIGSSGGSSNPGFNGARLGNSFGGSQLVSPNFNGLSRPVFGSGQLGSTPYNSVSRNTAPGFARGSNGTASSASFGNPRYSANGSTYRPVSPARVSNAWTDAPATRIAPASRVGRYGYNRAYDPGQSYLGGQLSPGHHLYPGAYNDSTYNHAENNDRSGHRPDQGGYRHYPNRRYNGAGLCYPYLFTGFLPIYYGGVDGRYGVFGDYAGNDSAGSTSLTNEDTNYGQPNFETTPNPYDDQYGNAPTSNQSSDNAPLPPNQPSQVGPEGPDSTAARPTASNGPDSLVEAVQDELSKRGYLAAKVDGVYGDPTREALRRFQSDHRLAATGRINEATLHALQLD